MTWSESNSLMMKCFIYTKMISPLSFSSDNSLMKTLDLEFIDWVMPIVWILSNFHPFHIVSISPWPVITSINLMSSILCIFLLKFVGKEKALLIVVVLMISIYQWWRDVVRESTYQGFHTKKVSSGIYLGFIMFILSELMFFFSFFFGFFFLSLSPDLFIMWPPEGLEPISYLHMPLLNTCILLSSGVSITFCHHSLINKNKECLGSLLLTLVLGISFSILQLMEYYNCSFCLSDGCYGSMFYIATGFHGIHVLIGSIFLLVSFVRLYIKMMSNNHHVNFEIASWYWHFVDVVWLFLYVCMYWW